MMMMMNIRYHKALERSNAGGGNYAVPMRTGRVDRGTNTRPRRKSASAPEASASRCSSWSTCSTSEAIGDADARLAPLESQPQETEHRTTRLNPASLRHMHSSVEFIGPSFFDPTGTLKTRKKEHRPELNNGGGGGRGGRGNGGDGGGGGGGGGGSEGKDDAVHALLVAFFAILPGLLCAAFSMFVFSVHCKTCRNSMGNPARALGQEEESDAASRGRMQPSMAS